MSDRLQCYASAAFGLEGLVSRELKQLNMQDVNAENGGVRFTASAEELFLCNMRLHTTDRLFVILASDVCKTFDSLFRLVQSVDWSAHFSGAEAINVSCKCSRSTLMSPRDCQSITKKAIIEKIRQQTGRSTFPETGSPLPESVSASTAKSSTAALQSRTDFRCLTIFRASFQSLASLYRNPVSELHRNAVDFLSERQKLNYH